MESRIEARHSFASNIGGWDPQQFLLGQCSSVLRGKIAREVFLASEVLELVHVLPAGQEKPQE